MLDLVADRRLDGEARQVKVEAAGRYPPPGSGRPGEILDQDLPGLDDYWSTTVSELVPGVGSEHQRKADHIQPVSPVVAYVAGQLHRGCRKIGKTTGYPAQLAQAY